MIKLLTGVASFSSGDIINHPDVSRDGSFNFFSRLAAPGSVPGALFCRRLSVSLQSLRTTVCRLKDSKPTLQGDIVSEELRRGCYDFGL